MFLSSPDMIKSMREESLKEYLIKARQLRERIEERKLKEAQTIGIEMQPIKKPLKHN